MRELLIGSIIALATVPAFAQTCDAGDALAFQCDFKSGKRLTNCSNASAASYRFGRPGAAPELLLRTPLATLDYATSGGSSMDTTEIVFRNGRTAYRLEYTTMFERAGGGGAISHAGGRSGTLVVLSGDRPVAHLQCGEKTIRENFASIRKTPCRDRCTPSP
jgi:hypothetical protein